MIPKGSEAIRHLVTRIAMDLMPKATDAYTATDLGLFTALLGLVAQDYDRAAEVLVTEHAAILPLLRQAAAHLDDGALKARIADVSAAPETSLRISALSARSDAAMKVLIDVHAAVEEAGAHGAAWAPALDSEIWRFLEAHVVAHSYESAL